MEIEQNRWSVENGWETEWSGELGDLAQLVLAFGSREILKERKKLTEIAEIYPKARILGCSTAGEIYDTQVGDDSLVVTAVRFEATRLKEAHIDLDRIPDSYQAGEYLAGELNDAELVHVFVLSDGLNVNGSDLVEGLVGTLPGNVTVTGGLSGDGERFEETRVLWSERSAGRAVTAIGFYGSRLKVGFGSLGGWDPFGPERLITCSKGNVLYEMDGKSALELYKRYLGDHADGLPATGLLFPLSLRHPKDEISLVRTILSIDETDRSMTFAGDVPEGAYARLMKANFDRLIDGAVGAARISHLALGDSPPDLAILISCVGRKMVLKQRVEEEIEGAREILGDRPVLTGFYSYGEISPFNPGDRCALHNQTMTITTFSEV
ncbi:MAG: hypothetical protein GY866_16970 [Proteobacteria bacterium]|nr:hypothetical protein [Pseudomonadota bacterium]